MPFQDLDLRVRDVRERIAAAVARGGHGQGVRIVAVTKTYGPDAVMAARDAGITAVGENRVQEALDKMPLVAGPMEWHLIGHLQRNKAKFARRFALVHSVDGLRLAEALAAEGGEGVAPLPVLAQVNVSGEASKGGFGPGEWPSVAGRLASLGALRVEGVMTMAPFDAPESVLRATFGGAREALATFRAAGLPAQELSMGMSGDFEVAVEEGATMVRLGTILFGARA